MTTIGLSMGAVYNSAYVLIALVSAYFLKSSWYLVYAFYHLTFAGIKHYMGHRFRNHKDDNWSSYRFVGYFFLVAAFIFHIMVIYVSSQDDQIQARYPFLVYMIALATFVNAIMSLSNLIRFRHNASPQFKASKNINFAASLFSIYFLQTMMIK